MNKKIKMLNICLTLILVASLSMNYNGIEASASTDWSGYAIYRDGVLGNLNDHAGLMDEPDISYYKPVIHAPGIGNGVIWDSWDNFLNGNNYIGIYRPKNATMTSTLQDSFVSKARELKNAGLSYNILDQIVYDAGSDTWVRPEHISHIRCDGVVEYVYEWYGYRVGGPDDEWDITRNLTANYWEHSGFFITPRKQH